MRRFLPARSWLLIGVAVAGLTACNKAQIPTAGQTTGNPADGNLAPASEATQSYVSAPATSQAGYSEPDYPPAGASEQPLEAQEAPPPLPEYSQPTCPGDNYIWTPGYWAWSNGYYWVPGAWVMAPWVGALWTPPWWGYQNSVYVWHAGYWAPHIGFYGGINYGFGYPGRGYYGAYWNQGRVYYNREVTNVNVTVIHNYYAARVPRVQETRISYNGGRGGIEARPTPQELAVNRDPRLSPVSAQVEHARQAVANRAQSAEANNQRPAALVEARPLATGYRAPEARPPEAAVRVAARPTPTEPRPAPQETRPIPKATRPQRGPAQPPVPPQRAGNQPAPEIRRPPSESGRRATPPPRPELPTRPEEQRAAPPRAEPQARPEPHTVVPRAEPPHPPQAVPPRAEPQARPEPQRAPASRPPAPQERPKEERK